VSFNLGLRYAEVYKRVVDPYYLLVTIINHENYQIKSLPLTVQYNLTHGVVQPFVFAGVLLCTVNIVTDNPELINNYDPFYHRIAVAWLGGAGVEVRLMRVLWVQAQWRYEYMAQYPTVGLALTLP
jgi:hypothetical protein